MNNEKNKTKLKRGQRPEGWKNNCAKFKEYYATQHPDWTDEQCIEAAKKFNRKNSYKTIEYWEYRFPDATHEEHLKMREQMIDKAKSNHPQNIKYWEKRFPDATHEEHLEMLNAHINKVSNILHDKTKQPKCIEFWLAKGYNEKEAKQIISESQKTFSLKKCIEKYGLEEGVIRFEKRQDKWIKSLIKNFSKYGDGRSSSSEFAYDIIGCICKRICINRPLKEKYMTDKNGNHYAYDFYHNKKIIEFNGDYWHMNPKIYKANDINKTKKLTAQEVWDFDKRKLECAEEHGYKVLYIWESEYNESRSAVIKKCMEFLTS